MAERHETIIDIKADEKGALQAIDRVQKALDKLQETADGLNLGDMGGGGGGGGRGGGTAPGVGGGQGGDADDQRQRRENRRGGGGFGMAMGGVGVATSAFGGMHATNVGAIDRVIGQVGQGAAGVGQQAFNMRSQALMQRSRGLTGAAKTQMRARSVRAGRLGMGLGAMGGIFLLVQSLRAQAANTYLGTWTQLGEMERGLSDMRMNMGTPGGMGTAVPGSPTGAMMGGPQRSRTQIRQMLNNASAFGYSPQEAIGAGNAFLSARGRIGNPWGRAGAGTGGAANPLTGDTGLLSLGINPGLLGQMSGLTAPGVGGVGGYGMGRLNNQVGEAQRSLAGAKVEQYLQMIAASTQGMAEVGLRVNQGDFLNFQSRMHTTSGSLGRRAHMMRGLAIPRIGGQLMQAQMGARSQLAAPFAGMGQMAVMATALQNSSSLMGAMQHVEEMARGGPETTLDAIRNIFPGMAAEGLMGLGIDSDSAGAMAGGLTGGGGSPRPRRRSRDDLTMAAKAHEFSNVGILKALNLSNAKLSGMMTTLKFIHDTLEARL